MSHQAQQDFIASVREKLPEYFINSRVLEVGSLNINGTVRQFFEKPLEYIGVDLGPGPGVDMVCSGHELPFQNNLFDISISCECFEHNKYWVETFKRMHDCTKHEGLIVMSCATEGRPEHGTSRVNPNDAPFTNDYYKNLTEKDFLENFNLNDLFSDWKFMVNPNSHDLYFLGMVCKQ